MEGGGAGGEVGGGSLFHLARSHLLVFVSFLGVKGFVGTLISCMGNSYGGCERPAKVGTR